MSQKRYKENIIMNIVRVYEIEYESLTLNFRREVTGKKISNEVFIIKNGYVEEAAYHLKEKYKLRFVFSPEFLGESKYFTPAWNYPDPQDMRSHTWQVFGGEKEDAVYYKY